METLLVAHYPQMPPSLKNGDNTDSTLSTNATVCETGTLLVALYPQMPPSVKKGDILLVAHYPQIPPSEKTGTILVAHYLQMPQLENNGDITGSALSANATVGKKRGHYW